MSDLSELDEFDEPEAPLRAEEAPAPSPPPEQVPQPGLPPQDVDLATALKEFRDANPTAPEPAETEETPNPVDGVRSEIRQILEERDGFIRDATALQQELATAREDLDARELLGRLHEAVPEIGALREEIVHGLLAGLYNNDPLLAQRWDQRHEHPRAWEQEERRVFSALREDFRKLPDPEATAVREAVAASLRGTARATPTPSAMPNVHEMTNKEYKEFVQKSFGYDTRVEDYSW